LTELNNFGIEVVIPESETLKEVLCPAKQDSMLLEPFTMLPSGGLKNEGLSMMIGTGKILSSDWVIFPKKLKPVSMPGAY
jgi:hypothetical protein